MNDGIMLYTGCNFVVINCYHLEIINVELEVDIYILARSGVDIIETEWNLSLEKHMLISSLKMFVVLSSQGDQCLGCIIFR
jgi:ABC-type sulfate transport system substrate-binding protein